jgi:hypothetical protein
MNTAESFSSDRGVASGTVPDDDRELLELAAKAAGLGYQGEHCPYGGLKTTGGWWNPLTDDGDALRLAVKVGIKVMPYPIFSNQKHSVVASRRWFAPPDDDENTYIGSEVVELYGDDPAAATRRAIVRAAAAIAKATP